MLGMQCGMPMPNEPVFLQQALHRCCSCCLEGDPMKCWIPGLGQNLCQDKSLMHSTTNARLCTCVISTPESSCSYRPFDRRGASTSRCRIAVSFVQARQEVLNPAQTLIIISLGALASTCPYLTALQRSMTPESNGHLEPLHADVMMWSCEAVSKAEASASGINNTNCLYVDYTLCPRIKRSRLNSFRQSYRYVSNGGHHLSA